jgi:23S rRNA pseudouridine1911/1915/1917 synthase
VADSLILEVPAELDGERVDKALAVMLDLSRARARALIDQGVSIDGAPASPADRVQSGATVETPAPSMAPRMEPQAVDFGLIHVDDALIVVDKPPGLVVHPGAGRSAGTLAEGLLHRFPELEGVGQPGRWGLVHRLDRDTSGVLLVARTQTAFDTLTADLAARRVRRVYTALAHGSFATETGTIEAPIGRDPDHPTRRAVVPGGKPAVTHYEVVASYPADGYTLLEVRLETGRTHQIRVHLAAIGHPVVGDRVYSKLSHEMPRIFLHARRVELIHPLTLEPVSYEAPLAQDLASALARLTTNAVG